MQTYGPVPESRLTFNFQIMSKAFITITLDYCQVRASICLPVCSCDKLNDFSSCAVETFPEYKTLTNENRPNRFSQCLWNEMLWAHLFKLASFLIGAWSIQRSEGRKRRLSCQWYNEMYGFKLWMEANQFCCLSLICFAVYSLLPATIKLWL